MIKLVDDGWKGYEDEGPYDAIHVGTLEGELPLELSKSAFFIRVFFPGW